MKVISGLFETYQEANDAVQRLNLDGYTDNNISVIAQQEVLKKEHDASETAETAGKGAGIGGIIGLVAGIAPIAVPGVGTLIGAGSMIGGAITGAGVGATAGGIVGAIKELFDDDDDITRAKNALKQGHILVAVETGNTKRDRVIETFRNCGAYEVREAAAVERAKV